MSLIECHQAIQICVDAHGEKISNAEARSLLSTRLKDYTRKQGELKSLISFVKEATNAQPFFIKPVNDQIGWSGDRVFKVIDEMTKENILFLKVFASDSKNFVDEVFSINFLNKVYDSSCPRIEAIGKFSEEGKLYFVVAQTPAPGVSFQTLYSAMAKNDRSKAFEHLKSAVIACGKGLAKLHAIRGNEKPYPAEFMQWIKIDLAKTLQKLPQDFTVDKLQKRVNYLLEKTKSWTLFPTATHGDVKLIHAFYNHAGKGFGLIDPPHLAKSIAPSGEPQGIALTDYTYFIFSILLNRVEYGLDDETVWKRELLTEEEAIELVALFEASYREHGGMPPSKEEKELFELRYLLNFIAKYMDEPCKIAEPAPTRLRDLSAICMRYLRLL